MDSPLSRMIGAVLYLLQAPTCLYKTDDGGTLMSTFDKMWDLHKDWPLSTFCGLAGLCSCIVTSYIVTLRACKRCTVKRGFLVRSS